MTRTRLSYFSDGHQSSRSTSRKPQTTGLGSMNNMQVALLAASWAYTPEDFKSKDGDASEQWMFMTVTQLAGRYCKFLDEAEAQLAEVEDDTEVVYYVCRHCAEHIYNDRHADDSEDIWMSKDGNHIECFMNQKTQKHEPHGPKETNDRTPRERGRDTSAAV